MKLIDYSGSNLYQDHLCFAPSNKIVQLEVCMTFSGRGTGMNIAAYLGAGPPSTASTTMIITSTTTIIIATITVYYYYEILLSLVLLLLLLLVLLGAGPRSTASTPSTPPRPPACSSSAFGKREIERGIDKRVVDKRELTKG